MQIHRRGRAKILPILPICAIFTLAACGGDGDTPEEPSKVASDDPAASQASDEPTVPDKQWTGHPERPEPVKAGPPIELSWRTIDGARVPDLRSAESVRERTPAGAVLSAAAYTVELDPRMKHRVWSRPLEHATGDVQGATRRLAAASERIQKKRREHKHDGPELAWGRPITVIGYSAVTYTRKSATVTIWARADTTQVGFYKRTASLRWAKGRWSLVVPVSGWRVSAPSESVAPITSEPLIDVKHKPDKRSHKPEQSGKNSQGRHRGSGRRD